MGECLAFEAESSSEAGGETGLHFLTIAVLWAEGVSTPLHIQPGPAFPTLFPLSFPETLST